MALAWRYAAAALAAIAICCVVVHVNDEIIRAEVGVVSEHGDYLYEHTEEDSDELSESEKALIAAANGTPSRSSARASKFSEYAGVKDATDKKRSNKEEDAEDDLSPEERALVAAANKGKQKEAQKQAKKKDAKSPRVVRKHTNTKFAAVSTSDPMKQSQLTVHEESADSDSDSLSEEEKALIAAANKRPKRAASKKTAAKKATRKTVASVKADVASEFSKKLTALPTNDPLAEKRKQLHEDSDTLTPEEEKLIRAADKKAPVKKVATAVQAIATAKPHMSAKPQLKSETNAPGNKKMSMKHAMEKITKAAARKAVAEQTEALVKTGKAVSPPTTQADKFDARSVVLGFDAAPPVAPDLTKQGDAAVPQMPATIPTKHSAEDVVYSTMLAAKQKVAKKLKSQLDNIKPVDTWKKQLAAADQKAQQLAVVNNGPRSPQQLYRAKMLREKMAAEKRKLDGPAANKGYDPTAPLSGPILNAHSAILPGIPDVAA